MALRAQRNPGSKERAEGEGRDGIGMCQGVCAPPCPPCPWYMAGCLPGCSPALPILMASSLWGHGSSPKSSSCFSFTARCSQPRARAGPGNPCKATQTHQHIPELPPSPLQPPPLLPRGLGLIRIDGELSQQLLTAAPRWDIQP